MVSFAFLLSFLFAFTLAWQCAVTQAAVLHAPTTNEAGVVAALHKRQSFQQAAGLKPLNAGSDALTRNFNFGGDERTSADASATLTASASASIVTLDNKKLVTTTVPVADALSSTGSPAPSNIDQANSASRRSTAVRTPSLVMMITGVLLLFTGCIWPYSNV